MKLKKSFENKADFLSPENLRFSRKGAKIFVLVLLSIFLISLLANLIVAEDVPAPDILGIKLTSENLEKIPQTPEEAANITSQYLLREWAKIVQEKAPFLWEIHTFLLEHQAPFNILLNRSYSFSWAFFIVLLLWIEVFLLGSDLFNAWGIIKQKIGLIVGFLVAVIIAPLGALNFIVDGSLYLISSQKAWWMRLLLSAIGFCLLILAFYFERELKAYFSAREKENKEEEIEQNVKELKAGAKGRKEAFELVKPIKKIKKEMFDAGAGI